MATAVDQLGVLTSTRRVVERSRYVRVDEAAIAAVAPGCYSLSISADGLETTIRLDGSGARLASVAT